MLRVKSFCDKCNKETEFSSCFPGDKFYCKAGHGKIFEPSIGHCKKCNSEIEFDAATSTFIINGQKEVICPSDYCSECDP